YKSNGALGRAAAMLHLGLWLEVERGGLLRSEAGDKQLTSLWEPKRAPRQHSLPLQVGVRLREFVLAATLPLLGVWPAWLFLLTSPTGCSSGSVESYRTFGCGLLAGLVLTSQRWLRL
ncbi:unnamed protein product, partial [Polarella glacialis]